MNYILRRRGLGYETCNLIASKMTTAIAVVRNDGPQPATADYVFRWGCTSNITSGMGEDGAVVNHARAIHWCANKKQGRLDLQAAGVPVPETWAMEAFHADCVREILDTTFDQFVLRPANHAQGRNLVHGDVQTIMLAATNPVYAGGYVSALIDKVAEYRVCVIQNRVAWVTSKTPGNPDDVAWNCAQGGNIANVRWDSWPMEAVRAALAAAKVSGTDFCGVDVMMDAEGRAYVLEVNSAPSVDGTYRPTCFAKCFDYIVTNGKAHHADVAFTSWKSAIHPAIWSPSSPVASGNPVQPR